MSTHVQAVVDVLVLLTRLPFTTSALSLKDLFVDHKFRHEQSGSFKALQIELYDEPVF